MVIYRKKKVKPTPKPKRFIRVDNRTVIEINAELTDEEGIAKWEEAKISHIPKHWSTKGKRNI